MGKGDLHTGSLFAKERTVITVHDNITGGGVFFLSFGKFVVSRQVGQVFKLSKSVQKISEIEYVDIVSIGATIIGVPSVRRWTCITVFSNFNSVSFFSCSCHELNHIGDSVTVRVC